MSSRKIAAKSSDPVKIEESDIGNLCEVPAKVPTQFQQSPNEVPTKFQRSSNEAPTSSKLKVEVWKAQTCS
jgi:hypothetical protein